VINHVAVFMDITERKAEQHLIDFLSNHDALTGLPNRMLARQRFVQTLSAARRDGRCVASCAWTWTASRASTTPTATTWATRRCRWWPST
jgi:hypothetical protein